VYAEVLADHRNREERSACPGNPEEQAWVEKSFLWLIEQFGADTLKSVSVVIPTCEFFPNTYDGSDEVVETLTHVVSGHMKVDPGRLDFLFYQDHVPDSDLVSLYESSRRGTAGLFCRPGADDKIIIGLEMHNLEAPGRLVAVIAHELAHVHLIADNRLSGLDDDHEPLADLLTVFFGLGVFTANAAFHFSHWQEGLQAGWSMRTMGYLPEPIYGHALAVFCWVRQELKPSWSKYLASDVEYYRRRSMRFLRRTQGAGLPVLGRA
jgi:hypothetical protein